MKRAALHAAVLNYQVGGNFEPILTHFLPRAKNMAYRRTVRGVYEVEDCIQDQMIALVKAAAAWTPSRGVPFEPFARTWMRQAATKGFKLNRNYADLAPTSIWRDDGSEKRELGHWDDDPTELRAFADSLADPVDRAILYGRIAGMEYDEIGSCLNNVSKQAIHQRWIKIERKIERRYQNDYAQPHCTQ